MPQVLPRSPLHQLEITFGNTTLILGQLFDSSRIALLEKEPTVSASVLEDDERYVLVLVGMSPQWSVILRLHLEATRLAGPRSVSQRE